MVIAGIVKLLKSVEAFAKIGWKGRRVVVSQRAIVQTILVPFIEGEVGYLLQRGKYIWRVNEDGSQTFGRRMPASTAAKRETGSASKRHGFAIDGHP